MRHNLKKGSHRVSDRPKKLKISVDIIRTKVGYYARACLRGRRCGSAGGHTPTAALRKALRNLTIKLHTIGR